MFTGHFVNSTITESVLEATMISCCVHLFRGWVFWRFIDPRLKHVTIYGKGLRLTEQCSRCIISLKI